MKWAALALLLVAGSLAYAESMLHLFGFEWAVYDAADWNVDQGASPVLRLLKGRDPMPGPRRPFQFAVAQTAAFGDVTIEADVRPNGRSLMLLFSYQDPAHFNYAHLSTDTGTVQPHHNGIFHVYGGERVRISSPDGRSSFRRSGEWYHAKLVHNGTTGEVNVQVDGQAVPALHAVDVSLRSGRAGLGSFDETADFKNVQITGTAH
jgi:hypothetical protein